MPTLALEVFRSAPRYLAARAVGGRAPGLLTGPLATLRLVQRADPEPPGEGWVRVRPRLSGICGSDLATLSGRSSFYFSPLVSLPFVPGHEVVGDLLDDAGALPAGTRVVLDPVLRCEARGLAPCANCAAGELGRCDRVTAGHVRPGLQIGYCAQTGGGWSKGFVAHRSQLVPIPDGMSDETAVLVEPLSCAVHAALRAGVAPDARVLVVGAGTVGVLTVLALRELTPAGPIVVAAKHPRQREAAARVGASEVVAPDEALDAVRRASGAMKLRPERGPAFLLGGVDVAVDAAGSRSSLDLALRATRAGGRVVLAGIPTAGTDLTPVWFRELEVVGAYTGGTETLDGTRRPTMELALELAGSAPLEGFVGATYPLRSWREAVDHALAAGRLGALKVAFDPRQDRA
ncbi:MAG TPA: zinc-binding dehydrogenase [Actinomycetota bacterium]|nr:zinc-binding dehydrogenase [Actinomycetota bacterium]